MVQTKVRTKTAYMVGVLSFFGIFGGAFVSYTMNNVTVRNANSSCEKLGLQSCLARGECQAVYGKNVKFNKCITLGQEESARRAREKGICENTQGVWQTTPFGVFCNCEGTNTSYKEGAGCK